jgi:hypothetical protein
MQLVNIFSFIKEKYLLLILILSVFPLYFVKISNSYLSLCFLSAIALLPLISFNILLILRQHILATKEQSLKVRSWCLSDFVAALKFLYIKLLKCRPFVYLSLLFIIILSSSLWSIETKELIKKSVWIAIAFSLFCFTYKTSLLHKKLVLKYITIYFYFLMAASTAIIIFRFCPNIDLAFLKIFISKISINPNILHDIHQNPSTYQHPVLSSVGGFFPNPNVAGAYLGINYFIARSLYKINNEKKYLLFCIIIATSLYATGSQVALLIWLILNFSIFCLCKKTRFARILTWSICLFLICGSMIFLIIYNWAFGLNINRFMPSIILRMEMFDFAYSKFSSHWLLGFGFGGWKGEIASCETIYHLDAPHNTLLALWGNSGIIATLAGLLFIYSILRFGYRLTGIQNMELNRLGYGVILSFLFYFIQGMSENYGLIGNERMCVILFIFLGYVYAQEKQQCL